MIGLPTCSIGSQVRTGNYHNEGQDGLNQGQEVYGYSVHEVDDLGIRIVGGFSGVAFSELNTFKRGMIVDVETAQAGDDIVLSKPRRIFNGKEWKDYARGAKYVYPRDKAVILTKEADASAIVSKEDILRLRIAQASNQAQLPQAQAQAPAPEMAQIGNALAQVLSRLEALETQPVIMDGGATPPPANPPEGTESSSDEAEVIVETASEEA